VHCINTNGAVKAQNWLTIGIGTTSLGRIFGQSLDQLPTNFLADLEQEGPYIFETSRRKRGEAETGPTIQLRQVSVHHEPWPMIVSLWKIMANLYLQELDRQSFNGIGRPPHPASISHPFEPLGDEIAKLHPPLYTGRTSELLLASPQDDRLEGRLVASQAHLD
jgi:hypothetical protein